jgi:uncharacterized protein (DUF2249 family)
LTNKGLRMDQPVLNLKGTPPEGQYGALDRAFEALEPGQALILQTGDNPRSLLKRLISERWGGFGWAPLRAEDGSWHIEVRRRAQPAEPSVAAFLIDDHRRLDALYRETGAALNRGELEVAKTRFLSFELGLRRHIAMEEEEVFPAIAQRAGLMGQGPTAVMREEHVRLGDFLGELGEALAVNDPPGFARTGEAMMFLLEQHNQLEEQMLYPMADDVLGAEAETLLKRLILY